MTCASEIKVIDDTLGRPPETQVQACLQLNKNKLNHFYKTTNCEAPMLVTNGINGNKWL